MWGSDTKKTTQTQGDAMGKDEMRCLRLSTCEWDDIKW